MAKATKNTKTIVNKVKKIVMKPVEELVDEKVTVLDGLTIELTPNEVDFLHTLLIMVGGTPEGPRGNACSILQALSIAYDGKKYGLPTMEAEWTTESYSSGEKTRLNNIYVEAKK